MKTTSKKVCKSCLGKKQNSVYKWDKVLQPDFIGDGRYLLEWEWITMVDCSRCKGTGLEPEFIPEKELEPQQNEVQESPSEDNRCLSSKKILPCPCPNCKKKKSPN